MQGPRTSDEQIIEMVLTAYRQGAFPMAMLPAGKRTRTRAERASDDLRIELPTARRIGWFSPDPRAILPLTPGGLHIPGGLRRHVRKPPFIFTTDGCFERVIRACARPRVQRAGEPENGLWIDETLVRLYAMLHAHGHAHSIEAWLDVGIRANDSPEDTDRSLELVGGLYGVQIGAAFFAESMFCRPDLGGTNASNLCLIHLVAHLRRHNFMLMDVQMANPHTQRFGVIDVPRDEYLQQLAVAVSKETTWGVLEPGRVLELLVEMGPPSPADAPA